MRRTLYKATGATAAVALAAAMTVGVPAAYADVAQADGDAIATEAGTAEEADAVADAAESDASEAPAVEESAVEVVEAAEADEPTPAEAATGASSAAIAQKPAAKTKAPKTAGTEVLDISSWMRYCFGGTIGADGFKFRSDAGVCAYFEVDTDNEYKIMLTVKDDLNVIGYEYWDDEAEEWVDATGAPSFAGSWQVTLEPRDTSRYTGTVVASFDVFADNDISNDSYKCWDDIYSDATVGADGYKGPDVRVRIESDDEDVDTVELRIGDGLEIVGYQRYKDDEGEWVDFDGDEPNEAGYWKMIVRATEDSGYIGTREINFDVFDELDMARWNHYRTSDAYIDDGTFHMADIEFYVGDDEDDAQYFTEGKDYTFAGFYTWADDAEDATPVSGTPAVPGEYFVKYVPAAGSPYTGERYIRFDVTDFNDIESWNLDGATDTIEIDGTVVTAPQFELYRWDADGKKRFAKLGRDFEVAGYQARNDDDEDWVDVSKIDGSYDLYRAVFKAISGSGFTGTMKDRIYVRNYNDLGYWDLTAEGGYFKDKLFVAPTVEVYRYKDDGTKLVLAEGKDYVISYEREKGYDEDGNTVYGDPVAQPTESGEYRIVITPAAGSGKMGELHEGWLNIGGYYDLAYGWDIRRLAGGGITKGGVQAPSFKLYRTEGGKEIVLVEGTDYTLSYERGAYSEEADEWVFTPISGTPTEAGEYRAVFKGIGAYTGKTMFWSSFNDYLDIDFYSPDSCNQGFLEGGTFVAPTYDLYSDWTEESLTEGVDYVVAGYQQATLLTDDDDDEYYTYDDEVLSAPNAVGRWRVLFKAKEGSAYHGQTYAHIDVSDKVLLNRTDSKYSFYTSSKELAAGDLGLTYAKNGKTERLVPGQDYVITSWEDQDTGEKLTKAPTSPGHYHAFVEAMGTSTEGSTECCVHVYAVPVQAKHNEEVTVENTSGGKGYYTGKITAQADGQHILVVTGYDYDVTFYADEALTKMADVEYSNGGYPVDLKAGQSVWFTLDYESRSGKTAKATFTVKAPKKTGIAASQVKLSASSYTYDGKAKTPSVSISGLKEGVDFTVSYAAGRVNVGGYKVTVTGIGRYTGTVTKTFTIAKAANKITVKVSKKTLKVKKLKAKGVSFKIGAKAKGGAKLTYSVAKKYKKYVTVSKSGKVTIKKGAKKGTYKIVVKTAVTGKYKAATKTITIKIK